jgi:hypothetical protein
MDDITLYDLSEMSQKFPIQIMKKFTSIIGEVSPTYAHLIKEYD